VAVHNLQALTGVSAGQPNCRCDEHKLSRCQAVGTKCGSHNRVVIVSFPLAMCPHIRRENPRRALRLLINSLMVRVAHIRRLKARAGNPLKGADANWQASFSDGGD